MCEVLIQLNNCYKNRKYKEFISSNTISTRMFQHGQSQLTSACIDAGNKAKNTFHNFLHTQFTKQILYITYIYAENY